MSVQTQIDRLVENVNAQSDLIAQIMSALGDKAIEGGGGSGSGGDVPEGVFYIGHGSFTPAAATQNYNIFSIDELRSIAGKNTKSNVSYFSLIVRIKNLKYNGLSAAIIYSTFWVNVSGSIQGANQINAIFNKNYSGSLSRLSISSGESSIDVTTGLTLNATSSNKFDPTEYVWTLIGYEGE